MVVASAGPIYEPRNAQEDRPRAKALGRNWRRPFGTFPCWSDKKESGFGLLVSRRSRQRNSRCRTNRKKKLRKPGLASTDREASPDAPPDFFLIFFWSSRPEHNQRPPTDTAKRRFALIPTRRKIAVSPLGAQSTPPLARGRSKAVRLPREPGLYGSACGAIGSTVRAPCRSLPLRDPKRPPGAYMAVASLI